MTAKRGTAAVGYAMVAIAASGWGTWPLILREAPMPPAIQSAVMMAVLTLTSFPFVLRDRAPVNAKPTRAQWLVLGWLGVGDAMNVLLFFAAYAKTSVAVAVLTHYLTPVFVALAAPLFLHERSGARTFVAVAVASLGLAFLLEPWRAGFGAKDVAGAALGAGSAVFYASNVMVNKRLAPVFSGSELMAYHGVVSTLILVFFIPMAELPRVPLGSMLVVAAGAAGPGALGGLLFVWGLRRIPASHASVLTLLEPFVAVVLAAIFLGQRVSGWAAVGGALILGGAFLVVSAPTTHRQTV